MDFGTNKTPVEIIKDGTFGRTYLRDIYSGVNSKLQRKSQKEFDELKNIGYKKYGGIIVQIIMMLMLINMVLNVKHN